MGDTKKRTFGKSALLLIHTIYDRFGLGLNERRSLLETNHFCCGNDFAQMPRYEIMAK